jgi:NAD(P)-dependent dehydrogenase (short-subunit alcohol dehydrogenase family)
MPIDFPDGCAFVLGGSGQLGQAICRSFARAGVPVALTYHSNRTSGEDVLADLRNSVSAELYQLDGSDRNAVARALEAAASQFGGIHSVIYAGGAQFKPEFFSRTEESVWEDWLKNDLLSAIHLAQAAIPYLRATKGAFTSLSTYQCRMIEVRGSPSAISKAALDAMVRAIAKEEGRHGVRANTLQAGWFAVSGPLKMMEMMPHLKEEKRRTIPLGRLGTPEELGDTVAFLSSRRAGFITGVNLTADGGESL